MFYMLVFSSLALAETNQEKPETAKDKNGKVQEEVIEEDTDAVDASSHLVTAPKMNPALIRDPFISFFDKKRQQQRHAEIEKAAELADAGVDPNITNYKKKHSLRPHDPLEEFDLGTLKLVAIMEMAQERIAMIENSTKIGYMVRVGEYMGTNNGRIIYITDDSVIILEEALSTADELIVEEATLRLHPDGNDTY